MSGDDAFFQELQGEFLTEAAFMLESYEELMMKLETTSEPAQVLTDIFRVAHSVKGGAAAVGLTELSKFAHVMEDLLDLLRGQPNLVNSEAISLLLVSGDELKKRIAQLQAGSDQEWHPKALYDSLVSITEQLSGKPSKRAAPVENAVKTETSEVADATEASAAIPFEDDNTNHELLAEILANLSPEDQAEFLANEKAQQESSIQAESPAPTLTVVAEPMPVETPAPIAAAPIPAPTPTLSAPAASAVTADAKAPVASAKAVNASNTTIKVDLGRVDSVLDAVGELVVLKNLLVHDETVKSGSHLHLESMVDQLDKAVRELYEKTLSIRMTPLRSMFLKIQRIVRDVSLSLGKPVELELVGEETEVERTVFELLGDPLVHLVRNSMDHGVEKPEIRKEKNKPSVAKVRVSAKQSGGNVVIEITDDGGGINRDKVLGKAIERGLVPVGVDPATLPDEQVFQFIFQPGFSTADKISDLSGRGVGLDVVKSNLDKINGKINIYSKPGQGSTFRLTIPLSTAITDGIIVSLEGARYILPIHTIREIVQVTPDHFTRISNGGKVANIRGLLLPVIDSRTMLKDANIPGQARDMSLSKRRTLSQQREESMLVVLESSTQMLAFPVDDVLGQAQVVVKPISIGIEIPEVSGAAILGDGRTVLILDPNAIMETAARADVHHPEAEVA